MAHQSSSFRVDNDHTNDPRHVKRTNMSHSHRTGLDRSISHGPIGGMDSDPDAQYGRRRKNDVDSSGPLGQVFGANASSKILLLCAAAMVMRFVLSSRAGDQAVKRLPRKYYSRVNTWQEAAFGSLFNDNNEDLSALKELERLSAGMWNTTSNLNRRVLKPMGIFKGRNKSHVHEKTGSRLLSIPAFLQPEECDELLKLLDDDVFSKGSTESINWSKSADRWTPVPYAKSYSNEVVMKIEEKLFNFTGVPTHRHDLQAHIGLFSQSNVSSLMYGIGTDHSVVATFILFLSSPNIGGEIVFPTFGRDDKRYRNLTYDLLESNLTWAMPNIEDGNSSSSDYPTSCMSIHCRQMRQSYQAIRQCGKVSRKSKIQKGIKTFRGGLALPTTKGSAALWYSRLRTGLPDPDMWFIHCPQDSVSQVLVIQKRLPVIGTGTSATWDFNHDASCNSRSSCI